MIDLQRVIRTGVDLGLAWARLPLTIVERATGADPEHWPPALLWRRVEATARDVAGKAMGDRDLVTEAGRIRAATEQRERSVRLEAEAAAREQAAVEQARAAESLVADATEQAREDAVAEHRRVERERERATARTAKKAAAKKRSAREMKERFERALEDDERRARRRTVTAEQRALAEEAGAVAAEGAVLDLREAADRAKARRTSG